MTWPRVLPTMTNESDDRKLDDLVASLRAGDHQALGELFSNDRDRLRRMIEFRLDARLRGRVSPSDVLQEAYIDALKRLPHFQADPDVPFYVWIRTITIQQLIQVHRHHLVAGMRDAGREVSPGRFDGLEASSEKIAEFIGDFTSPSQAALRGEAAGGLRDALDALDPLDREVLALRHFEGLGNHEVAVLLGIKKSAASKRYVRALERLRDALEQRPGFPEGSQ